MIPFHELRVGDIVLADYDGQRTEGEVTDRSEGDKLIQVDNGVQTFWYEPKDLYPIVLDEHQLMEFGFQKEVQPDGQVKFKKGPFRILLSREGDFSGFQMWYREDDRHIHYPLSIHQLQNHYQQMTKVDLRREVKAH
jgi:hypothetical protein